MAQSTVGRPLIRATAAASAGANRSRRSPAYAGPTFGWFKTVGAGDKLRSLGWNRNKLWLESTGAFKLTRLADIQPAGA